MHHTTNNNEPEVSEKIHWLKLVLQHIWDYLWHIWDYLWHIWDYFWPRWNGQYKSYYSILQP